MVDVSAIGAISASLNAAISIAKAMKDIHDASIVQSKVWELQGVIIETQQSVFAAQQERAALIERVGELEKLVTDLKNWEAEKQRYELKTLPNSGVMAYAPKAGMQGAEPLHYICANCYQDGQKSILQPETRSPGRSNVFICNRCSAELYAHGMRHMETSRPSKPTTRR